MSDQNQLDIPDSFVQLYLAPGQIKPSLSRADLHERFEFCDDLASLLSENARNVLFDLSVAETDVLERFYTGLLDDKSTVTADEAGWVIHRLTELLQWDNALASSAIASATRDQSPPSAD